MRLALGECRPGKTIYRTSSAGIDAIVDRIKDLKSETDAVSTEYKELIRSFAISQREKKQVIEVWSRSDTAQQFLLFERKAPLRSTRLRLLRDFPQVKTLVGVQLE